MFFFAKIAHSSSAYFDMLRFHSLRCMISLTFIMQKFHTKACVNRRTGNVIHCNRHIQSCHLKSSHGAMNPAIRAVIRRLLEQHSGTSLITLPAISSSGVRPKSGFCSGASPVNVYCGLKRSIYWYPHGRTTFGINHYWTQFDLPCRPMLWFDPTDS
jgi:hypothetical protein